VKLEHGGLRSTVLERAPMIDHLTVRVRDVQKSKAIDADGHDLEAVCHKPQ